MFVFSHRLKGDVESATVATKLLEKEVAKFERKEPSSVKKTKPVKNDLLYDFDDDDSEEVEQEDSAVRTVRTYLQNNDRSIQLLNNFPSIKKVYMKYNTIMPSSAGPERLFSKGKLGFNTKRHTVYAR